MGKEDFDLKLEYKALTLKHNLPDFRELAEDFDIEKINEKESSFLLREIRRVMNEKISVYIHFFEILINPTGPPMFIFTILRNISEEDKKTLKEIYKTLSKTQIEVIKLDTIYKEEAEVKFINEIFNLWQKMKPKIYKLAENFKIAFGKNDTSEKRSYFD